MPLQLRLLGALLLGALVFPACSGGGTTSGTQVGGDFLALKSEPTHNGRIFLNDPVSIDFSSPVDLDSASLTTMTFTALDQLGTPVSELVSGEFKVATTPGDATAGRRLQFVPHYPTNNTFDNGGFRAGRTYIVQLVSGTAGNGTALRDRTGRALEVPISFAFSTAEGTTSAQLFRNPLSGGPRRTEFEVATATSLNDVPLNLFGAPPVEIRLRFDQALNPHDANVPVSLDTNPLVINSNNKGRIFLEYDDPSPTGGLNRWIPADVELESNSLSGAVVVLRPIGVLPNNATVRVIVEATVEDISGENNLASLVYNRVFATFQTSQAYNQQWNGISEHFTTSAQIDFTAPFPEPLAEYHQGYVKANFDFEGQSTTLEYEPTIREVILNTSFTQIAPKTGLPFNVSGGVFNFRNVTIPAGVTVKGQGPNPLVWLVSGDFKVAGTMSVEGGDGDRVNTLNAANFAKAGGVGACGGGNGGAGTPSATLRDLRGATGNGPLQVPGEGGGGGLLACLTGCYTGSGYNGSGGGSGGGGGGMATQGDPWYLSLQGTGTSFQQRAGIGGAGCSGGSTTRTGVLAGGPAGLKPFVDSRSDNDFWGGGIDLNRNLRITGELAIPVGGGGGGGGGDTSPAFTCSTTASQPANDYSGGGGGGGGGVLIVKALGNIEILTTGKLVANGGRGGGGEQVGACGEAGGGGGGAGGMVVLMSAKKIILHTHGTTNPNRWLYSERDYNFAISADGNVCRTGSFGSVIVNEKYPPNGTATLAGTTYDENPLGGFGGMGVIQLMTSPGLNALDGTNTRLDDNIQVFRNGLEVTGATKKATLAWRGFPNAQGVMVDDSNTPTNIGNNEGDLRPTPTLLPVPLSSKSRLRSKWIDTGLSNRRDSGASPDGLPRGIVTGSGAVIGPNYEFAGTSTNITNPGYVNYVAVGSTSVKVDYPQVVSPTTISTIDVSASYLGKSAVKVTLAQSLGGEDHRYRQYQAELITAAGAVLGSGELLAHSGTEAWVGIEAAANLLPGVVPANLRVIAKFFDISTNGTDGLGPTYSSVTQVDPIPVANLRIGFAFHADPQSGVAAQRFPLNANDFLYDLQDAGFQTWIGQMAAQNRAPRYVMWDVTFDTAFSTNGSVPPSLGPTTPLPQLRFLRLPFRF